MFLKAFLGDQMLESNSNTIQNKSMIAHPGRREGAQGMVEFAMALPLMLVLVFGIIEAGRLMFAISTIYTGARNAARYGSAAGGMEGAGNYYQDCAGIQAAGHQIADLSTLENVSVSISYLHPDGTSTTGCPPSQDLDLGDRIVVTVSGEYHPMVPLINFSLPNISSTARRTIIKNVKVK
jgi:hypothetical protein